jgi:hypothetical protein
MLFAVELTPNLWGSGFQDIVRPDDTSGRNVPKTLGGRYLATTVRAEPAAVAVPQPSVVGGSARDGGIDVERSALLTAAPWGRIARQPTAIRRLVGMTGEDL